LLPGDFFFTPVFILNNQPYSLLSVSHIDTVSYGLQAVKRGDTIFVGQYLFTGSETTSVWLEVKSLIFILSMMKFMYFKQVSHVGTGDKWSRCNMSCQE